jgi:hypothetical protein
MSNNRRLKAKQTACFMLFFTIWDFRFDINEMGFSLSTVANLRLGVLLTDDFAVLVGLLG